MARKKKIVNSPTRLVRDGYFYLVIIAVGVIVRLPFLKAFDLVSYDGTYYIHQARSMLAGAYRSSVFPIGYPLFIALFIPFVRDGVRAAQTVSFLAGLGSLIVFYVLGKLYIRRSQALIACLVLAITPLFIRYSTTTMSEAVYIFWILLGLLLFAREKDLLSGLFMGIAAITRPEAIGIFAVLALLRSRKPKRLAMIVSAFLVTFSINLAVLSIAAGKLVLMPKASAFGIHAEYWKVREAWIEFEGKDEFLKEVAEEMGERNIAVGYLKRLPKELLLLARHASPVLLLLALYGMYRRRIHLLAAFVPFFVFPLFTSRTDPRFVLPYIPWLILFSFIGLSNVRKRNQSRSLLAALLLTVAFSAVFNREQVIRPVSEGYEWAKRIGLSIRDKVKPGDTVADRKPYFAFYAGGDYVEIPVAQYDDTMEYLASNEVDYLVLHSGTIHQLRPALLPLLFDWTVINGELRYRQIFYQDDMLLYERNLNAEPLRRERLALIPDAQVYGPSWSPDGKRIAFRMLGETGKEGIYIITLPDDGPHRIMKAESIADPITWSPDSRQIAFSGPYGGNLEILAFDVSGELIRITSHEGADTSPFWSVDGREIVFCSDRSGRKEIWIKDIETGAVTQLTTNGGYSHPSISPDGKRIAWIRKGEGLCIHDRSSGAVVRARGPLKVAFRPEWSPDGGFIAVTGSDWGSTDVYMVTADGLNAVLLTKTAWHEYQPAWRPDGAALVTVVRKERETELSMLTEIEPYKERLLTPYRFGVLGYME